MQLIQIEDIRPTAKPPRFALFELGFRPFYLGAALFAALAVPVWLWIWASGAEPMPIPGLLWHAHELVFGFAAAVVAGFLFTAVRNWTGLPMPHGLSLGLFFALWLAGRIAMASFYHPVTVLLDVAFLFALAIALARKFLRARNTRNWPLVGVVSALGVSNLAFHGGLLGWWSLSALAAVEAGLMFIVLLECIIAGRVIPGFTANALPGLWQFRRVWLDRAAIGFTAAAFALELTASFAAVSTPALVVSAGFVALVAAGLQAARLIGWNPWATRTKPILWILHVSYAWIPLGLALLALAAFGWAPRVAAVHALAVGSMAGLILGMMTRTALGHTGRPLRAGLGEVAAYGLIQLGALIRVGAALVPGWHVAGVWLAGIVWTLAFVAFVVSYLPILIAPRVDGRRG